jgi:hypothetical protein
MQSHADKSNNNRESKASAVDRGAKQAARNSVSQSALNNDKPIKRNTKKAIAGKKPKLAADHGSPLPVQLTIGGGGLANVDRMVLAKDNTISNITKAEPTKYQNWNGPTPPPWFYYIKFMNGTNEGGAMQDDPNYDLVPSAQEADHRRRLAANKGTLIPVRTNSLQKPQESDEIIVTDNKLVDSTGRPRNDGIEIAFVITDSGDLKLGSLHTGLTGGNAVMMAGEVEIKQGVVKYTGRRTGHYWTSAEEETRGLLYMQKKFPWIQNTEPKPEVKRTFLELLNLRAPAADAKSSLFNPPASSSDDSSDESDSDLPFAPASAAAAASGAPQPSGFFSMSSAAHGMRRDLKRDDTPSATIMSGDDIPRLPIPKEYEELFARLPIPVWDEKALLPAFLPGLGEHKDAPRSEAAPQAINLPSALAAPSASVSAAAVSPLAAAASPLAAVTPSSPSISSSGFIPLAAAAAAAAADQPKMDNKYVARALPAAVPAPNPLLWQDEQDPNTLAISSTIGTEMARL